MGVVRRRQLKRSSLSEAMTEKRSWDFSKKNRVTPISYRLRVTPTLVTPPTAHHNIHNKTTHQNNCHVGSICSSSDLSKMQRNVRHWQTELENSLKSIQTSTSAKDHSILGFPEKAFRWQWISHSNGTWNNMQHTFAMLKKWKSRSEAIVSSFIHSFIFV